MQKIGSPRAAQISVVASSVAIGAITFFAAWQRRWMADDGLIVLRTVRNLLAGNGPVFNAGERVEANTSTLWQYLIYLGRLVTGAQLEAIAMWLAITLSVAALVVGTWATAQVHNTGGRHATRALVLPAGALVYLALPPARDFFTSGLEWGLSIFYLAVLWWLLTRWVRGANPYLVAFWAGLSWLVRPELALYGGLTGIVLLVAHRRPAHWAGILGAALPLPLAYQVFRMGYYGLLTPHTAVAKSAADAAWDAGVNYLGDFVGPYWLWLPLLVLAALAAYQFRGDAHFSAVRSQPVVVALMVICALIHLLYVLRVGGDFMHGRMLLQPLFALLLPVFVLPVRDYWAAAGVAGIAVWAVVIAWRGHPVDWQVYQGEISIVDERDYWTYATKRQLGDPPKDAEDFQNMRLLRGFDDALNGLERGDALAIRYLDGDSIEDNAWTTAARDDSRNDPPTLYLINMGMSSMHSPLNVRVLDNIGLATPLAARQPRIEDGRIGHDKSLPLTWQAADSAVDIDELPAWYDKDEVAKNRRALEHPDFQKLFATYRDPLDADRFFENIKFSLADGRTLQFTDNAQDYLR